jgi:ADP-heptose:LPS heptosyltransferase
MAAAYPYVKVEPIGFFTLIKLLVRSCTNKTVFVVPPTFFDVPTRIAQLMWILKKLGSTVIGFDIRGNHPAWDITLPFNTKDLFYKNFITLLQRLGLPEEEEFKIDFVQDQSILLQLTDPYIVFAPFASTPSKTLPQDRWVELLRFLQNTYPQTEIVIIGAPGDEVQAHNLVQISGHTAVKIMCGVPFAQVAAIIAHGRIFIGVDSGLTHVASVGQVPVIAIENLKTVMWLPRYNPNAVILVEPKDCLCQGDKTGECYREIDGIRYPRCLVDIPQDRIESVVRNMIQQRI